MSNGNLAQEPSKREAGSGRNWARMREEVRGIIRAEIDKLNPTEDARHPLELILESSIRYADVDGRTVITVMDRNGQPRMIERDGQSVPFTLQDLLEELRRSHPMLFRSSGKPKPRVTEASEPAPASIAAPEEASHAPEKPHRDWLNLDSIEAAPVTGPSQRAVGRTLFRRRRGKIRFHGWMRKAQGAAPDTTVAHEAPEFQFVEDPPALSLDRVKPIVESLRTHAPNHRRGIAIGAIALAVLLGIGAFALVGRDRPAPAQPGNADGPAATGTLTTAQAQNVPPAPVSAPSGNRTLRGSPDVIDTATLSLQGEVVRLFGVEWAPGGGKPEDLTRYLQGREVTCEPVGSNDTYRCMVGGQDLSRVVLFNGGGKPTEEATPDLKAAADKAREGRLGVWNQ